MAQLLYDTVIHSNKGSTIDRYPGMMVNLAVVLCPPVLCRKKPEHALHVATAAILRSDSLTVESMLT
ncbi:hypothetical protein AWENTII_012448 [Aspergillus wentii]